MSHLFECSVCNERFDIHDHDNYDDHPHTRKCISCGCNPVKYLGYTGKLPSLRSDDMGIKGVLNPADGKTYDSKSAYEKSVKAMGLEIVGNDAPTKRAAPKQKDINWEKAVAQTLQQTPLKGKSK